MVLISLVFCRRHRHNGRDAARNSTILNDLDDSSRRIDLRMHVDKTKVFISEKVLPEPVAVHGALGRY